VLFLDVETTGLSWFYDELTVVGWACNGIYEFHLAGQNPASLLGALDSAETLVTFNGMLFDLRFLRKEFGEVALPPVHIDLRYLSMRVGLTGGQKSIENILGLRTRVGLEGLDGGGAVLLWNRYLRGDREALIQLIDYNRRDIVGMYGILDEVIDRFNIHPDLLIPRTRFASFAAAIIQQQISERNLACSERSASRSDNFDSIFGGTIAERAKIVGIDLTGSEARGTGWCVLQGRDAETRKLFTDDEIVTGILCTRPALVSIDSPLSIPFGRTRVEDNDPGRERFGIMRRCERELKRRGVNVYPCLLPSMQGLTRRGIRLADRIRSEGIPVIESYPGAAQDILGIPRKGAGIEYLRRGLADFGIRGPFADTAVSHDELDAIASALVGSFFLSGRYEALRGPTEDALIIPDRSRTGYDGMVVGISGRICAGKTTTARLLEQRGFAYTRFSAVTDDEIMARGEAPDRARRQRVGIEINQTKGQRWLCEKVLERVGEAKLVVIDGLRFPEDHAFFVERFGCDFVHFHISAPEHLRAIRYRKGEQGAVPFEVADKEPVEGRVDELRDLASAVVGNDSSVAQLSEKVLNHLRG
jgi:predicted nuclease with RNAse H fold/dephospho-CoA kinase